MIDVLEANVEKKKTSLDYRRLNHYDIMKIDDVNKVIIPFNRFENNEVKFFYVIMKYTILFYIYIL